jgi:UDP-N-acetylmuramate--alanine ligase
MHIFFCGIGGSGLSGLAHLALDLGFVVSGSDLQNSQNIKELATRGATIFLGQKDSQNIKNLNQKQKIDWFVQTAAIKPNHPELQFVQKLQELQKKVESQKAISSPIPNSNKLDHSLEKVQNNSNHSSNQQNWAKSLAQNSQIKISKRDEFINFVIREKNLKLIAVAGTHGKTTTTGILVWLFKKLEIPISYLVGSNITFGSSGQFQEKSKYFILECDEFDRNFLKFEPEIAIIPSLDYDHPDTYLTQEDYLQAFWQFLNQVKSQIIPANEVIEKIREMRKEGKFFENKAIKIAGGFGNLEVLDKINLIGLHNRQNAELALFAITVVLKLRGDQKSLEIGFEKYKLYDKINTFPGTDRRFQKLGENIYSDYAHHPSEIAATLELAREIVQNLEK